MSTTAEASPNSMNALVMAGTGFAVIFAMIGNAKLMGIDIALFFILPFCLVVFVATKPVFRMDAILLGLAIIFFASLLTLQTLKIIDLDGYWVWPVKAIFVALFVKTFAQPVDDRQLMGVFAFVAILIITSQDINGRSYGLFGPNMLYRFYGLSYCFALYQLWTGQKFQVIYATIAFVSVGGIVVTGSVGGMLLVAAATCLYLRFSVQFMTLFLIVLGVGAALWPLFQDLNIVARLMAKADFQSVLESTRISGILSILTEPFGLMGQPYVAFSNVWRPLYLYPHNVFVELYAFFGATGLIMSLLIIIALIKTIIAVRARRASLFHFAFFCVFIGSNLSGDLSDNYGVVGLGIGILLVNSRQKALYQTNTSPDDVDHISSRQVG